MWLDEERDLVMISALEHYSYCPRQCALIHIEQTFTDNLHTLRGSLAHERVDQPITRQEECIRVERGLPLWSRTLGLIGRADVVEFHKVEPDQSAECKLKQEEIPYPVEYKKGRRRAWQYEALQVCAQAMCLEEMLGVEVPRGAIYYCSSRTRREVMFDQTLRAAVVQTTEAVRDLLSKQHLPAPVNDQRCNQCSLIENCLPDVIIRPQRISHYRAALFKIIGEE